MENLKKQNIIEYCKTFLMVHGIGVELEDEKLVLHRGKNIGCYASTVVETEPFNLLVGSFAGYSDDDATIELEVRVRVDDVWSKFFTYGEWGMGRDNYYYDQDDAVAKMSVDEIFIKDGKQANALQYKITLKKTKQLSPKVSLVAFTMIGEGEKETKEYPELPKEVNHDVPCLNQNIVPEIGNQICSPTTITMLLMHRGFDFSDKDPEFPHRYIAKMVADPGHNSPTYGNWVYNTAVAGALGLNAYVARFDDWNELKYHLATVGPVGASIKGDTGVYKTGGHLLVVRGYKETDKGTFVLCNDPNINDRFGEGLFVYYEYPLETFMNFWRGVAYIIEK